RRSSDLKAARLKEKSSSEYQKLTQLQQCFSTRPLGSASLSRQVCLGYNLNLYHFQLQKLWYNMARYRQWHHNLLNRNYIYQKHLELYVLLDWHPIHMND